MNAQQPTPPLILRAETAADLMTSNPISIRADATVQDAIALLTDRGIGAVPVIDDAGRPVGVLSQADLLAHAREKSGHPLALGTPSSPTSASGSLPAGQTPREIDTAQVRDLMTPVVFSVTPETPAGKVVKELSALKVHQVFVLDGSRVLVGVITALDILRHLH